MHKDFIKSQNHSVHTTLYCAYFTYISQTCPQFYSLANNYFNGSVILHFLLAHFLLCNVHYFQFYAIINKADINLLLHLPFLFCFLYHSLGYKSRSRIYEKDMVIFMALFM